MLFFPPQSKIAWQYGVTACHVLALLSTLFRISYQARMKRLWVDDYVVVFAQVVNVFCMFIVWFPRLTTQIHDSVYYLNLWAGRYAIYTVIWASRLALILSFSKIFPPRHSTKRVAYFVAAGFVTVWTVLLTSGLFLCGDSRGGTRVRYTSACHRRYVHHGNAISACDLVADAILIALPVHTLWRIKLRENERRFILLLFVGSVLIFLSVVFMIVLATARVGPPSAVVVIVTGWSHFLAASSIMVANLMVVASFVYRFVRSGVSFRSFLQAWGVRRSRRSEDPTKPNADDPVLALRSVGTHQVDNRGASPIHDSPGGSVPSIDRYTYASQLTRITESLDPPSTREIHTS